MSKQTEALKLALEALEWINRVNAMDFEYKRKAREALNAIYEALAEQPALPFGIGGGLVAIKTLLSRDPCAHAKVAIEMIDAMLAEQPAQQQALIEPIEFLSGFLTERLALERGIEWTPAIHDLCNRAIEEEKLAEQAAISAGPITPAMTQGITPEQKAQIVDAMQRYTAQPPRKPWSGLTTADRKQLLHDHHPDIDPVAFFDAVEAKLKEKNA